jgi:hypothetical protein
MKIYLSSRLSTTSDNSSVLNNIIASAKDKTKLIFPDGNFPFNSPIIQTNKGLVWEGSEDTNLILNHPNEGLRITRSGPTSRTVINGVNFLSRFNGVSTTQHGIISHCPITIKNIIVENFHGDGIQLTADVAHTPASDVSFCHLESIYIRSCDGNAVYLQGGDANAGTFIHCDARDCGGVGFLDASFLGNNFFGCMTHGNAGGSFKATDLNSRSNFFGCYCESGQPPVELWCAACWFGGLPSDGIILHGPVARVFSYSTVNIIQQ